MNPGSVNHVGPILAALVFAVGVVILAYQKRLRLETWIDSLSRFFSARTETRCKPELAFVLGEFRCPLC